MNHVVRVKNTHSFQEYVADPEVARYMLLQMTNLQEPKSNTNLESCKEAHRATSINGAFDEIEAKVTELRAEEVTTVVDLLKAVKAVKDLVDSILDDGNGDVS